MTDTTGLRAAITGLIGLAATEEEMLLTGALNGEDASPDRQAAGPLSSGNSRSGPGLVIRSMDPALTRQAR